MKFQKNNVSVREYLLIRQFMGANLLSLEQVDSITALTHMKVPYAEYLSSQAYKKLD